MALRSRGLNAFVADSLHLRAEDSDGSDNDDFGSPYDRRSSNISSVNILSSGVTKDSFEGFHGGSSQSQKFVDSSKQSGSKQRYVNAKQKINVSENVAALLGLDDYYNSISSIPRRRRSFNDINGQNELVADSAAAGNKIQYDGFYKISSNEMLPIPTTD
ncbi:hypothetical protein MIR68_011378 [Amoeboaphelidium protococcarum]|nr:hypothetical protein MIR68_011378 [Amoeboaphelidium protococcarum]